MKKTKLNITVITDHGKDEYNLLGEYDEEKQRIHYQESRDLLTDVILDLKNKILIRDNKDYNLNYQFLEEVITETRMNWKELNQSIILKIKTQKFKIMNTKIEIIYTILDSDETIQYIIKF